MSYILEALKRAEQERTQTRPVDIPRDDDGISSTPLRPTSIALAGATLFLAGIGVATLLMRPTVATTPATVPPALAPVAAATSAPSKPLPKVSAAAADDAGEETADAPTASYESLDDVAPVFQGTVSPSAPMTPASRPLATPIPMQPEVAAVPATPQPQIATTPAAADPGRALPPTLRQMPAEFRARFPELLVQVHVFDTDPARRWLMIDNRRYGEGATLDAGPRIVEIMQNGAIFELGGQSVLWPLNR